MAKCKTCKKEFKVQIDTIIIGKGSHCKKCFNEMLKTILEASPYLIKKRPINN